MKGIKAYIYIYIYREREREKEMDERKISKRKVSSILEI